jgi:ERCC4-related helicase
MSLCHGKKLLATHGYESFAEYIDNYFDLTKKDKKNVKFLQTLKSTPDFSAFMLYLTESRATKNHPKLRKLAEILIHFFKDPKNVTNSKVIIFS